MSSTYVLNDGHPNRNPTDLNLSNGIAEYKRTVSLLEWNDGEVDPLDPEKICTVCETGIMRLYKSSVDSRNDHGFVFKMCNHPMCGYPYRCNTTVMDTECPDQSSSDQFRSKSLVKHNVSVPGMGNIELHCLIHKFLMPEAQKTLADTVTPTSSISQSQLQSREGPDAVSHGQTPSVSKGKAGKGPVTLAEKMPSDQGKKKSKPKTETVTRMSLASNTQEPQSQTRKRGVIKAPIRLGMVPFTLMEDEGDLDDKARAGLEEMHTRIERYSNNSIDVAGTSSGYSGLGKNKRVGTSAAEKNCSSSDTSTPGHEKFISKRKRQMEKIIYVKDIFGNLCYSNYSIDVGSDEDVVDLT